MGVMGVLTPNYAVTTPITFNCVSIALRRKQTPITRNARTLGRNQVGRVVDVCIFSQFSEFRNRPSLQCVYFQSIFRIQIRITYLERYCKDGRFQQRWTVKAQLPEGPSLMSGFREAMLEARARAYSSSHSF